MPQKTVALHLLLIKHLDKDVCFCFTYIVHFYCLKVKEIMLNFSSGNLRRPNAHQYNNICIAYSHEFSIFGGNN